MSLSETSCVPLALKIPFNIPQKSHMAPKVEQIKSEYKEYL
jgi:hypothetical protein